MTARFTMVTFVVIAYLWSEFDNDANFSYKSYDSQNGHSGRQSSFVASTRLGMRNRMTNHQIGLASEGRDRHEAASKERKQEKLYQNSQ